LTDRRSTRATLLVTDAAHLLSDLGTFIMSLVMLHIASRRASSEHSFGYHRAEVLGALFSVLTLWLVTGMLVTEAVHRLKHPEAVKGGTMFGVAIGGVAVNLALVAVFSGAGGHGHSHGGLSSGHGHSHGGGATHTRMRRATRPEAGSLDDEEAQLLPAAAPEPPPPPPPAESVTDFGASDAVFFTRGARPMPLSAEALAAAPPAPPPRPRPAPCSHGHSHGGGHSHGHGHSHGEPGGGPGAEGDEEVEEEGSDGGDPCEEGHQGDMNVRSAYLHVIGDLLQSLGVALAGGLIWWRPSLRALDPILTFTFSIVVLATTGKLLRDIVDIVMERCPRDVDAAQLASGLASLPGVASVHDLHIWALVPGKTVLTVHVEHGPEVTARQVLVQAQRLMNRNGILHSTIQVEPAAATQ
jgi:zinc transporter 2